MTQDGSRSEEPSSLNWVLTRLNNELPAPLRKESPGDWRGVESVVDALAAADADISEFDEDFHLAVGMVTANLFNAGDVHLVRGLESGDRGEFAAAVRYLDAAVRSEEIRRARAERFADEVPWPACDYLYGAVLNLYDILSDLGRAHVCMESWEGAGRSYGAARECGARVPELVLRIRELGRPPGGRPRELNRLEERAYAVLVKVHDQNLEGVDAAIALREGDRAARGEAPAGARLSGRARRRYGKRVAALTQWAARLPRSSLVRVDSAGEVP